MVFYYMLLVRHIAIFYFYHINHMIPVALLLLYFI